ncbi:OmpA family protein [Dokdonia sp.]|uniref:OmpA family protein n=1 Tax=Dokdonia sp. TaxID=2024995 RepID=UPI0032662304
MKGFLGTFFIFLLWASAGIYYTHIKESRKTAISPMVDTQQKTDFNRENTTNFEEVKKFELPPENSTNTVENDSIDKDSLVDKITYDIIENLSLTEGSSLDSQSLADEIKKSIAISDTIDIDKDEPEVVYKDEKTHTNKSSTPSRVFYPSYSNSDLILDKELVVYATELKKILKENPSKKVTIIGHTDNVGNAEDNFRIGLKKSRQIKWYLTARRGIQRSKITAISRGELTPIEENSSIWGRKKNNRIEIIVD